MFIVDYAKRAYRKLRHFRITFIVVHYFIIIGSAIFGTFLFYPAKTTKYIDALFQCACAATQAGLNTVDLNSLKLWQQMVLYCISMWTNPIVIHSGVVFMRLHWFEKSFKDIKNQSKLQSKLRRTATTLARQDTLENGLFQRPPLRHQNPGVAGLNSNINNDSSDETPHKEGHNNDNPNLNKEITFGNLPQPKRTHSVEPEDMYRSINLLSHEHPEGQSDSDDDGPALVIRGPRDRPDRDDDEEDSPEIERAPRAISFSTQEHPRAQKSALEQFKEEMRESQRQLDAEHAIDEGESSDATQPTSIKREDMYYRQHPDSDSSEGDTVKKVRSNVTVHRPSPEDDDFAGTQPMNRRAFTLDGDNTEEKNHEGAFAHFKRSLTFDRFLSNRRRGSDAASSSGATSNADLNKTMSSNYLSWSPTVGRNSAFVDLTEEQKEELGGIEYRALKVLSKVLVAYFVGFHLMCAIMLLPWAIYMPKYRDYVYSCGVTPTWWAFFTAQSTFNDVGFTLTPDSMGSYQEAIYVLLTMSFFIVIGNTGFPVLLRFIIWIMFKLSPRDSSLKECTGFLLDHPRRCFTMLFPSTATWWLFATLVILNSVDLVFFIILDFNAPAVTEMRPGYRVVSGLFQAFSTRTAGFTSVSIAELHPSIQVSYMIMMYIAILPIAISIRRTNVYEEQSLGIYGGGDEESEYDQAPTADEEAENEENDPEHLYKGKKKKHPSYVTAHLRAQLGYDLWYIFLGLFIICICEGTKIKDVTDLGFTGFTVLFEVVSAYGTVGMSMGYDDVNTSLSGKFSTISKLIIIAMMIRGRHRGLPYSVDRAIILPSDEMHRKDDAVTRSHLRRGRTMSANSNELTETMGLPYPMRSHTMMSSGPGAGGNESYPLRGSSHSRQTSNVSDIGPRDLDPIVPSSPMPSVDEDYLKRMEKREQEQEDNKLRGELSDNKKKLHKDEQGIEMDSYFPELKGPGGLDLADD
ncbi:cation transport protein-domain-containing protein [Yarrowia lipolytica]|jgi:potassium uptake Trk family protein|uniref:Potassium transport protein n=2 Tax=Yarrowia lipolytica TaxID=4952 RepID=Q6CE78_YARLI|nr:YALI0B17864p [Yarrowia lipolytica CLIB122]AOW01857.1 hypothetical protein YALI1_B23153g [Yarrowia lipolytica]KAB8280805.1 cation transport protein-domain-containing protein [Yarrowia lipolytica]KAE8170045.1 cation transport protein-domain-containing protein [Yarrowia lipolytica]KAJ8052648.1 cation transport protein-domain-containing protein [Yarrowia lipolytica]QNP97074.1 Low-affinity potassium transport protein [Yarrowia lipolytica]|eukprot:XP_501034.1 YALI0B17864p [Yarrowia lipolytica CLIB122]